LICLGHMLEYNRNLLKASENFWNVALEKDRNDVKSKVLRRAKEEWDMIHQYKEGRFTEIATFA
jgi:hypothetical protein